MTESGSPSHIEVVHTTDFQYDRDIAETIMELRLQPLSDATQRCLNFQLTVDPPGHVTNFPDSHGNVVHHFNYRPRHRRILIVARSVVETGLANFTPGLPGPATWRYQFRTFDGPVQELPEVLALADQLRPARLDDADEVERALVDLTTTIHQRFQYQPGVTNVLSTVADMLQFGAGVCQDFTHFWIAVCRAMAIPARYVSGDLHEPIDVGDYEATHAWPEAWIPGKGWSGFDPTNPTRATPRHVKVAVGRDYRDVAPTKGVFLGPANEQIRVQVQTRLLNGAPA